MVPVLTRTAGRAAAAFTPDVCLAGSARLAVAPFPAPCRRGGGHSHGALFCRRAPEVTRRRAVDDGDLGASSLDKGFEVMLQQLRDAGNENLRECLEQNTAGLGIDFLTWLAQQQEAARPGSSASQELESLISRILCIREGFEPISTTDALELASGPDESEKEPLEVLAAGYGNGMKPGEQVMRHAQTALTQEGSSKLHEKAEALRSSMLSAKQDSATALMGRRAFPTLEEARGAEQAAAATNVAVSAGALLYPSGVSPCYQLQHMYPHSSQSHSARRAESSACS
mmetsp:Transcript_6939/g.17929  ORF Transcript_6939/g.17929 Transcript_6939/m.17929 type:complete len:285 (-) Transcript_6939:1196-2050(-)